MNILEARQDVMVCQQEGHILGISRHVGGTMR